LRASEENLRATLDSIGDAVVAVDSTGRITHFNPVASHLTGCKGASAVGRPLHDVLSLRDPETRALLTPLSRQLPAPATSPHVILTSACGKEVFVSERITPIQRGTGEPSGTVLVFRDVTQQRDAQERMLQARKLEAIGQLAGGVAHDFNNLLTGILGNAELLADSAEPSVSQSASTIVLAARRAADLTGQLLRFSRNEPARHKPVDIHLLIREACQLLSHSMDKRIEIELELDARHAIVSGDASQLQNAFLNLGLNARDALHGAGSITIRTRDAGGPEPSIEISFADTGTGIDPAIQEHIFEPFFTTKEVGSGTGLGLAGTYGIVRSHGGQVEVSSQPGEGACFVITLPRADGLLPTSEEKREPSLRGAGRILVIDDEELVRSFVARALVTFGYEAVCAEDGVVAEELFEPDTFDLVVLDLVMPKRSGLDTFHALAAIDPKTPILIASGYSRDHTVEEVLAAGAVGFLHKPFQLSELAETVADALGTTTR
jgi:PAS domain S-box-containing protein